MLALVALVFAFPLVFMVVSSVKPDRQFLQDTGSLRAFLPVGDISLDNCFDAFERAPIGRFMLNSTIVTVITVVLSILICSVAALSFTFLDWTGRNVLLSIVLATLIVPFEPIAIRLLLEVSRLPWLGTAAILKSLKMHNEQYLWPLIVVQDEAHRPIMVGPGYFFQLDVAWGELMAHLTLISLPVLVFYLVLQRAFIASIASTGVKG